MEHILQELVGEQDGLDWHPRELQYADANHYGIMLLKPIIWSIL